MSSLREMSLRMAMPIISKLYESVGLKSMILLKDDEWINVVTVIAFTRRKVEDLNNEYRLREERLGKLDYDNFKIILQARPISEIHDIVTELDNGYLHVGELNTKLLSRKPQEVVDQKIGRCGHVLRVGEYSEYLCYGVTSSMKDTPDRVLSDFGISASMLGVENFDDLARSWLELQDFRATINIHFIIPIYATVTRIQYEGGNEIKAGLKMDHQLSDDCTIWLRRMGGGDYAPILERTKCDVTSCENVTQNGFVYTVLRHSFSALGPKDRISVDLLHNELGLLATQEMRMTDFTMKVTDPFSRTFALFDAGKNMEKHLLDPKTEKDFEAAFSWLLEMVGIQSLKLGRDEIVRENKTEKGSADIIAYDSESSKVLLIDCTIGVPSEPKIDRIKNTADYISRKITFSVEAVIVTAVKSPLAKGLAQKYDVKILDNTDLEKLIGLCKKGYKFRFRAKKMVLKN